MSDKLEKAQFLIATSSSVMDWLNGKMTIEQKEQLASNLDNVQVVAESLLLILEEELG